MSFRGINQNALDVVRELKDNFEQNQRDLGSIRQNSIRLGNWVLEAEADELVKMTNLTTGVISYVGANGEVTVDNTTYLSTEFPPFSFGGVIRNAFASANLRSNHYIAAGTLLVNYIYVVLEELDETSGPRFRVLVNNDTVYTSPAIVDHITILNEVLTINQGDLVQVVIFDDGAGFSVNLTVMFREGLVTVPDWGGPI